MAEPGKNIAVFLPFFNDKYLLSVVSRNPHTYAFQMGCVEPVAKLFLCNWLALIWSYDSSFPLLSLFRTNYFSGTRTVSDWGGTVTATDSFFGCAESRFAERKSVWVTASGRDTRMSRSDERLYTR